MNDLGMSSPDTKHTKKDKAIGVSERQLPTTTS